MHILDYNDLLFRGSLEELKGKKLLINTLNAYSFVTSRSNPSFRAALLKSDLILPDGVSIILAMKLLTGERIKKISGADLFEWEMQRLEATNGKCFFLGSTTSTLNRIVERCKKEYPNVSVQYYSPPFRKKFNKDETQSMIEVVNQFSPDVLFVGMTAPKQEQWAAENIARLKAKHVCCIGAVFDFYAGTVGRAPAWMIYAGLEWLYRLVREPKRMWRRYLIGNTRFISLLLKEKITHKSARA